MEGCVGGLPTPQQQFPVKFPSSQGLDLLLREAEPEIFPRLGQEYVPFLRSH